MTSDPLTLRGMTWDHPRGYEPLVAAVGRFNEVRQSGGRPTVALTWDRRPLSAFEQTPLDEMARRYDLIVIDHPHLGEAVDGGCLLPLDELADAAGLASIARGSVGGSYESYRWAGRQWALPIDAAAQVSAWREGVEQVPPTGWEAMRELMGRLRMVWPLKPVHALMSFFTLAANRGTACRLAGPRLLEPDDAEAVLEEMAELAAGADAASWGMDPIDACEAIARGEADFSPMLYGYVSYARAGFRAQRVIFRDLPAFHGTPAGSTLGGTGLGVSRTSENAPLAVEFAVAVASGEWQKSLVVDAGGQPAHAQAWADPRANAQTANFFAGTRRTLDAAWTRPRFAGYVPFQHDAGQLIARALRRPRQISRTVGQLNDAFAAAQIHTPPGPLT